MAASNQYNLPGVPDNCIEKIKNPDVKKSKGTVIRGRYKNIEYEFNSRIMEKGGFSRIHKGTWKTPNSKHTIIWKVTTDIEEGLREAKILKLIRKDSMISKHTPRLFEVFYHKYFSGGGGGIVKRRRKKPNVNELIIIVMEYIDGCSLGDHIVNNDFNSDAVFFPVVLQLTQVLNRLHNFDVNENGGSGDSSSVSGIAHRDIKVENIFLRRLSKHSDKYNASKIIIGEGDDKLRFEVVIIDFGMSVSVESTQNDDSCEDHEDFCGTKYYMPPEILHPSILSSGSGRKKSKMYDPRARDLWSLGVVLWIMMGEDPSSLSDDLASSEKLQGYLRAYISPKVNNEFYTGFYFNTLLGGLMCTEWTKRWTTKKTIKYLSSVPLPITLNNKKHLITPQQLLYLSFVLEFVYTGNDLVEWSQEIEKLFPQITKSRLEELQGELDEMIEYENESLSDIVLNLWSTFIYPIKK